MFCYNFWLNVSSKYPSLTRKAILQHLVIPTTWEREQVFFALMSIKTKSCNCLDAPGNDFHLDMILVYCKLGRTRIDQLIEKKQLQPSH